LTAEDPVDMRILEILRLDGRASIRDIAKKVGISPATVSRKIRQMEDDNIIKAYVSIIEDEELGKGSRAVLLVRTSGEKDQSEVIEDISNMDDICNVFLTMGNYDLILTACTINESELYNIIKRIRALEGILWVDFASIVARRKVLSTLIHENNEI
jgi:Lrp/AsnC family transcriptional regulator, leucine-responsive regulatory protein